MKRREKQFQIVKYGVVLIVIQNEKGFTKLTKTIRI